MNTKHLRIIRLVDHYGIPLRFAKQFAKYSDWKERAGQWQREEDPAKLTHVYKPKKHPDRSVEGCQGMTNQGNRCRVKDTTAHTHEDKCQREEKDFCWMHCDCSYCSQMMSGAVKTQGQYYTKKPKKNTVEIYKEEPLQTLVQVIWSGEEEG